MNSPKIKVIPKTKGGPESLGRDMQKHGSLGKVHRVKLDPAPGEFDDLLREIEKEAVPERLLELARQLQAALVESRKRQEQESSAEN